MRKIVRLISLPFLTHWPLEGFDMNVTGQAISWANIDPDLSRYLASLGHKELNEYWGWEDTAAIFQCIFFNEMD